MKSSRRIIQLAFLALTLGAVFGLKGNAERWCPLGGVEALYQYAADGNLLCSLGVSNFYILAAVLVLTLLARRALCGYACPVGTLSEWLARLAGRVGLRPRTVPPGLDRGLGLLKYGALAVVLFFTWRTGELVFRGYDPCYALISRHGEDITFWAYAAAGAIALASVVLVMPFCRWLCPLAAVLSPFSRFGLTRIKRGDACIDCGQCAAACPMAIRVDLVREVSAARCTSCFACTDACAQRDAGALTWGPPNWLGRRWPWTSRGRVLIAGQVPLRDVKGWPRGLLVGLLLACVGAAVAAAYAFPLPAFMHTRGAPPAQTATVYLQIRELNCRGRAMLLTTFLDRNDDLALPGYLQLAAWPGAGVAPAHVTYDPAKTTESAIRQAITAPYFDPTERAWLTPPFEIEGYDPLASDG